MKVTVDMQKCQANALCMEISPEVFLVSSEGYLSVLDQEPPDSLRDQLQLAVESCPTQAILVENG
ncbi:MAG TPA: ferredoxin [Streptosporangiaceae bacterium]|jgi:ferredoxin